MNNKVVPFRKADNCKEDVKVYIGGMVKARMEALGVSVSVLAEKTFMEESQINKILNNEVSFDQIDEADLDFISQVLYCKPDYFIDETAQRKDILSSSMNRGCSDVKSNIVKGKLQQFAEDYVFLWDLMNEIKGGN